MLDCFTTYKLLFYALDSIWEKDKDEMLGQYLSEMNPFLFNEEGSADPSIYNSFKKTFNSKYNTTCTIKEGYILSIEFLSTEENIYAKKACVYLKLISLKEWEDAATKILK